MQRRINPVWGRTNLMEVLEKLASASAVFSTGIHPRVEMDAVPPGYIKMGQILVIKLSQGWKMESQILAV